MSATLTAADVRAMTYVDLIALLRETNRCPGGKHTIRRILRETFVDAGSRVLEVGSNTGFTSLEIARTARCSVVGIDVVASALAEAKRELACDTPEIQARVRFQPGSAYEIPFPDASFDLCITGGATSFMDDKRRALSEYHRVIKPWGFLAVANLCYLEPPPQRVIDAVSSTIGVQIQPWTATEWHQLFEQNGLFETYVADVERLAAQSDARVESHVDFFMQKPHLEGLAADARAAVRERWLETLRVFNENHRYLGFVLGVFRKRALPEEPELFVAPRRSP